MCLSIVIPLERENSDFKIQKDKKGYYGWKCYKSIDKEFARPIHFGTSQHVNKWIKHEDYYTNISSDECVTPEGNSAGYPRGFHVYVTWKGVWNDLGFRKKVYVKEIIAKGYQLGNPIVVCKEIFITKPKRVVKDHGN